MNDSTTDFSLINRTSNQSFNAHKKLIKQLLSGKTILCETCRTPLKATLPPKNVSDNKATICCPKGCTDIELETD